jgi:hypothetical protein
MKFNGDWLKVDGRLFIEHSIGENQARDGLQKTPSLLSSNLRLAYCSMVGKFTNRARNIHILNFASVAKETWKAKILQANARPKD